MPFGVLQFIKSQRTIVTPVVQIDLSGKTVIVTGANIGLGFEAAKHFARMKPGKLILACRSEEKGRRALTEIREQTGCASVELWVLDLASFASVKAFGERFEREGGRLDILVENAGVHPGPENKLLFTRDRWEESIQVNHLSTSLLALLLLPRLLETAQKYQTTPRLVVVSSDLHHMAKFEQRLVDAPNPFQLYAHQDHLARGLKGDRYPIGKLLNILFVRAFNERLDRKPVIVNGVTPGFCYSALRRDLTGSRKFFIGLMEKGLARGTEEGSRILVWAAAGAEEKKDELRGAYISLMEVHEPSDYVISEKGRVAQEKLWENLIDELTKVEPNIRHIVKEYLAKPVEK